MEAVLTGNRLTNTDSNKKYRKNTIMYNSVKIHNY